MKIMRLLSLLVLLVGCAQQGNVFAANTVSAQSAPTVSSSAPRALIARGSLSPAAPVKLEYRIAHAVVANQQNSVSIDIVTRLDHGTLLVEVARQQGVSLLGTTQRRFDLASAPQPIKFDMQVMPGDQPERFLVLLLTVDTEMGPMSRSFRIDLSTPAADGAEPPSMHD